MRLIFGIVSGLLLAAAAPASAHHSFSAEFDASKCSDVTGILTKVNYENPHSYIFVDVKNADGKTVTVRGCASRNGEPNRYAAPWIKLADGVVQRVGQDVEGNLGVAEQ